MNQPSRQDMAAAAKAAFDLYDSYVKAGFSEEQALKLISSMMLAGMSAAASDGPLGSVHPLKPV